MLTFHFHNPPHLMDAKQLTPELKERFETILGNYDFGQNDNEGLISLMQAAYNIALADRWVSVKERLPENRHWCLVFAHSELFLANYKHGIFETEEPLILHGVTHWQPLPSPPISK